MRLFEWRGACRVNDSHGTPKHASNQQSQILSLLRSANGGWVPLPKILALGIAQYNARIYALRRAGFDIQNRVEEISGVRHSWFRLVPSAPTPEPARPKSYAEVTKNLRNKAMPLFAAEGKQ
jgi:hypothetical protein